MTAWPAAVRDTVPVNALVTTARSIPAHWRGFPAVKVKVGRTDPRAMSTLVGGGPRRGRPRRARCASTPTARGTSTPRSTMIRAARAPWTRVVEQPVARSTTSPRLRRRVDVPLAADECVRSLDDARCFAALDAADVVVLKHQPLGGVRAALRVAEAAGVPAVVSSMMETSVGIAAGSRSRRRCRSCRTRVVWRPSARCRATSTATPLAPSTACARARGRARPGPARRYEVTHERG